MVNAEGTGATTLAPDGGALSHRAALLWLAGLTVGAGVAARLVGAIHPQTLLPWVAVSTVAIAWTFRRPRAVDLFDPFVFVSWTHYAPVYVVGALLLAVGIVEYPYRALVADPIAACALALLYIVIGYLALRLGCRWQGVRVLGARLTRLLPAPPSDRTIPLGAILLLVAMGGIATYGAFRTGIVGFAVARPPGPLDAAASYAGVLLSLGHFLFWFRWFDDQQVRPSRLALAIPFLIVVFAMTINGNRGALFSAYLVAALAFRFARGRPTLRQNAAIVVLAFVALGVGMVYGTTFRTLKGGETGAAAPAATVTTAAVDAPLIPSPAASSPGASESGAAPPAQVDTPAPEAPRPSLTRQLAMAAATTRSLASNPGAVRAMGILASLGQRLNLLSDASVAIARYRELRPLEAEHGVANLWTMTWTALVPRVVWPGKPKVGNVRAYSALYFGWDGNSYAWTPPADLIRNGGPLVMPLGMAVLGILLGVLSVALTGPGPAAIGERAALFSLLLVSVNLEGPYGLLLPTMLRIGVVVLVGLGIVRVWSWRRGRSGGRGSQAAEAVSGWRSRGPIS